MNRKNEFKINLLRQQYKKNKKTIMILMRGMSSEIGKRELTEDEVESFFLGDNGKLKGADYAAIALQVAKAICAASKVICPYIEVIP